MDVILYHRKEHSMIKRTLATKRAGNNLLLTFFIVGTMLLGGCSSIENNVEPMNTEAEILGTESESEITDETQNKTISEIIYGDEISIWYHCGSVDKDSVPTVYVMYGDGTYFSACKSEYTLGKLSKMTDNEIISWVEDEAIVDAYYSMYGDEIFSIIEDLDYGDFIVEYGKGKYYKESIDSSDFYWIEEYFLIGTEYGAEYYYEECESAAKEEGMTLFEYLAAFFGDGVTSYEIYLAESYFSDYTYYDEEDFTKVADEAANSYNERAQEGIEALKKEIKSKVEESEITLAYHYGLSLKTDSTGNSVSEEVIYFEKGSEMPYSSVSLYTSSEETREISIMSPDAYNDYIDSGVVYESIYSGRKTESYMYMLVRVDDEDIIYQIDEIGTNGILVDEAVTFD